MVRKPTSTPGLLGDAWDGLESVLLYASSMAPGSSAQGRARNVRRDYSGAAC